ncbi:E3 SUMO-protein ligase NSE2 isoform X2 [Numida meleagris]|uniref:E3 SUMO-protein ligase NSE2 isoform X2 n=1 Tax=Numida meleagris TaxID=8996 RepID=UPI000B3DE3F7|nr:E3 SUMO-protein ligase NSE2 isoform X2 [Numida meleagris]
MFVCCCFPHNLTQQGDQGGGAALWHSARCWAQPWAPVVAAPCPEEDGSRTARGVAHFRNYQVAVVAEGLTMPDFQCLSACVGLLMLTKGELANCSPSLLPEPSFLQEPGHVSVFSGFQLGAQQLHKRCYEPSGACATSSPASCVQQRMPRPRGGPGPAPPLSAAARGRHGRAVPEARAASRSPALLVSSVSISAARPAANGAAAAQIKQDKPEKIPDLKSLVKEKFTALESMNSDSDLEKNEKYMYFKDQLKDMKKQ